MVKAIWNGKEIAASEECIVVEGNQYFPPESVKKEYFKDSSNSTICPWKGTASYYNLEVDGENNPDAAWYYPDPSKAALEIKDYVAFWRGVEIQKS
ncbi:MAG: DUF427 domain-containing protein [Candidatus Marinimicrobia bacterium]|nr:DUF427 domain-containing protein [Candidatus Neomarinimicrobiota bacterium]